MTTSPPTFKDNVVKDTFYDVIRLSALREISLVFRPLYIVINITII